MTESHTHTSTSGITYTTNAQSNCSICAEDALIGRFSRTVRNWNPYKPGVDPYRLADLLEGKDGPKDYHHPSARNERAWASADGRFSASVLWGVNWAIGVQVWADRDYGLLYVDFGPLRLNLYARWGLTEEDRIRRWVRRP